MPPLELIQNIVFRLIPAGAVMIDVRLVLAAIAIAVGAYGLLLRWE